MPNNLAIDVGNTRTKVGIFNNNEIVIAETLEQFNLKVLEGLLVSHKIKASIIADSGHYQKNINELLTKKTNFVQLGSEISLPITNKYETPETLGKDRLCGIIGAATLQSFKNNILVIDTGTCITFNFINNKMEYLGGSIAPGLQMRLSALPEFTHKLPLIKYNYMPVPLTGKNTESSILSGVVNGIITEIDGLIDKYSNNYKDLIVYITGGGCYFFEKQLKNKIFANPNLVLIGLNKILTYNATH